MSVVDDVRKVIQDLVTPDMRAVSVRLDHVEQRLSKVEDAIKDFDRKMEKQLTEMRGAINDVEVNLDRKAEKRHEIMVAQVKEVINYAVVLQRMEQVEEKQKLLEKRLEQ